MNASAPPPGRLLSIYEASKRLNCSTAHIRRLIETGRIRAINIGIGQQRAQWRVTEDALTAFLQGAVSGVIDRSRS